MPTSQTRLTVYNLAIDVIKDTALQAPDQDAATARWLNRNWDHAVETTLRAYPWNFAKQQAKLSAEATAPLHTWAYAYKPPSGWLRVLPIRRGGDRFGPIVPHEVVGNLIFSNEPAPLYVTLIMDKSANPGEWDALFTEIVRCKLGLGMANKFTAKRGFVEEAKTMLRAALDQAEQIDAYEGSPEPVEEFDILRARGADPYALRSWR